MLFNLSKLFSLFLIFQQLRFTNADNEVRFITSDGVVYSYDVITSTIKPATVIVRTSTYTTTRVKAITLENHEVTSTTEEITTQATVLSSVDANYQPQQSNAAVTTTSSSSQITPVTVVPSQITTSTSTTSSSTTTTQQNANTNLVQDQDIDGTTTRTTSTLTPTTTNTSTSSKTTITSTSSSTTYSLASEPTTEVDNNTCFVYYDDPDDEYYSTAYITDSSMTVDAATTLTSTQTVYATMTLM